MLSQNTKESVKERRIFRYTLADAWEYTISQVDVMEGVEKGNVFNIFAFRDAANVGIVGNPPYKGKEVLKLYDDISKILSDNVVDQKYLSLDYQLPRRPEERLKK